MTAISPNSLVTALGKELLGEIRYQDNKGKVQQVSASRATPERIANALADDPTVAQLVTFAGFLGGSFTDSQARTWRLFYLDPKLLTWLLFDEADLLLHRELTDLTMLSTDDDERIVRDLIWLRSSASVTEGSGPPRPSELEAQFLRGDFIGAGDFSESLTGGTFSRATGLLCEVQTPGCCGRRTR